VSQVYSGRDRARRMKGCGSCLAMRREDGDIAVGGLSAERESGILPTEHWEAIKPGGRSLFNETF
jgi:hypothetical protein